MVAGEWTLSLVDRKAGDVGACADITGFLVDSATLGALTCTQLVFKDVCVDGNVSNLQGLDLTGLADLADGSGRTMTDACCACGGGRSTSERTETLLGWTLEVYGTSMESASTDPIDTAAAATSTAAFQICMAVAIAMLANGLRI